jgi:hypothetical protein
LSSSTSNKKTDRTSATEVDRIARVFGFRPRPPITNPIRYFTTTDVAKTPDEVHYRICNNALEKPEHGDDDDSWKPKFKATAMKKPSQSPPPRDGVKRGRGRPKKVISHEDDLYVSGDDHGRELVEEKEEVVEYFPTSVLRQKRGRPPTSFR